MKEEEKESELYQQLGKAKFVATSHRLMAFANDKDPLPTQRVVYLDGSFDLFHPGHIELIKKAKALGDFLYVGIFDDSVLNESYMSLHERVLMVLA